jgi:tetratricopeptide (TPR) repeat protein
MLTIPNEDLKLLMEAGYLFVGMKRFKEAQEVFEGIAVLVPKSEIPLVALGSVFAVQTQFDQAIKIYQKALELEPKSAFATAYLGEAYFFKGEGKKATGILEQASQLDPDGKSGDFARALLELIKKGFVPEATKPKK